MRRSSALLALAALAAAGCSAPLPPDTRAASGGSPQRIVSLDYCADQYVLKLADRSQIAAVSPDAAQPFSYMRREAAGLRRVRPSAEEVLALKPDLVVRSYGGGLGIETLLARAGVPVHQLALGDGFDAVGADVRAAADAMGQGPRGTALAAEFERRLAAARREGGGRSVLYVTRGGVTTGPGSGIDRMITTAGLTNFEKRPGWNPLPLERLVSEQPDVAVTAFFGAGTIDQNYWSESRHPVVRDTLRRQSTIAVDGAATACNGWFIVDVVEQLSRVERAGA